jgi:hypothetical protein
MFFSFFIFTQLDTAQPRRRTRVQPILFNIFLELARRLIFLWQRQNDAVGGGTLA